MSNKKETDILDSTTEYLDQLQTMMDEISMCINAGGKHQLECAAAVTEKAVRNIPLMKNLIYPWKNYDWS